jgi:hypothetical protein
MCFYNIGPRIPFLRRKALQSVVLLVLTTLDQLLFVLKMLFTFVTKQATSIRRSTVLSLPIQLVFPSSSDNCSPGAHP